MADKDPRSCDRPDSGAEKWVPTPQLPDPAYDVSGKSGDQILDFIQSNLGQAGTRSVEFHRTSAKKLWAVVWKGTE